MNTSKVWSWWLLIGQLLNAIVGSLSFFIAVPDSDPILSAWKAKAVLIHAAVATVIGVMQAFAKSLADADGDGVPDIFQRKP